MIIDAVSVWRLSRGHRPIGQNSLPAVVTAKSIGIVYVGRLQIREGQHILERGKVDFWVTVAGHRQLNMTRYEMPHNHSI